MDQQQQNEYQEFATDYERIKRDIKKVVITNLVVLILLIALYFVNAKTGILTKLYKFF